jgi:hypothetical protein
VQQMQRTGMFYLFHLLACLFVAAPFCHRHILLCRRCLAMMLAFAFYVQAMSRLPPSFLSLCAGSACAGPRVWL